MTVQRAQATRVTSTGQLITAAQPIHRPQITERDAASPPALTRLLLRLEKSIFDLARIVLSSTRLTATTFEGKTCGTGGATFTIQHGYQGRTVRWQVARWYGASAAYQLWETANDGNVLTLASGVAGTADIEVWPV